MDNNLLEKTTSTLLEKIEHKEVTVEHYSDNVVIVRYKAPHDVDIALIDKVNASINQMVKQQDYVAIVFAEPGVNFTPEGRAYGASEGHLSNKKAWAAVTDNLAQVLVVNFFMRFNKPATPFRLFKTEKDARKWLRNFI